MKLNPDKIFSKLFLKDINYSKKKFSILIPYRNNLYQNRFEQLKTIIPYLEEKLSKYSNNFKIIVIEQNDDGQKFNRGSLLNIGHELAEKNNSEYLIFHDVDLLPNNDILKYYLTFPHKPIHIGNRITKYTYDLFIGAVFSVSIKDNKKVNGFSNCFWGWGGEDDAYLNRMVKNDMTIYKVAEGVYDEMPHKKDWKNVIPKEIKRKLIGENKYKWKYDGINSIKYEILNKKYLTKSGKSLKYTVKLETKC